MGGVGEIDDRFKSIYRFVSKINVTQFSWVYIVKEYRDKLTRVYLYIPQLKVNLNKLGNT